MMETKGSKPATGRASMPSIDVTIERFLETLMVEARPPLYTLPPDGARAALTAIQSGGQLRVEVDGEDFTIIGGPTGEIGLHIVRPRGFLGSLPVVLYFHGGGWVMGDRATHDRFARELAAAAQATVVLVEYARAPEAVYPIALEQAYAATQWIATNGAGIKVDTTRLAVLGDCVGGTLATAVTMLARDRGGPRIAFQVLLYPVADARFDTASYAQFADGPWLTRNTMQWFWDSYLPDEAARSEPTASPLRATPAQLRGLPPALIITAEADVLRDEGEAYAHRLLEAGVPVTAARYLGTIHDFLVLNPIADSLPTRAALAQAATALRAAFAR
jgi:acetyl esterase